MDKNTCYFCDKEMESTKHIFIECENLKTTRDNFINKTGLIINENNILKIQINKKHIKNIAKYIFGIWKTRLKIKTGYKYSPSMNLYT